MDASRDKWSAREIALLAALVGAAILVRLVMLERVLIVSRDAIGFIGMARTFAEGDVGRMLEHAQHPFYPFLVALTHFGGGGWIEAGRTVSVLAGALAVIPLYLLTRAAFSPGLALVAGLLFAFLPSAASQSADVLTEPTYVAVCLAGLYCAYRAAWRGSASAGALLGLFAGLAYLTRPEGGGIFLLGAGALLVSLFARRRGLLGAKLVSLVMAGIIFTATAGPYLVVLRSQEGHWRPTKKKKWTQHISGE